MSPSRRNWAVLLGAVAVLFVSAALFGVLHKDETPREILYARSALPAAQLSQCFAARFPPGQAVQVHVREGDGARRIDLRTPGGRKLTAAEAASLRYCLGGHG